MNIEVELDEISYEDCGVWRSYSLVADGNSYEEMLEDAHIFETDQDGGELNNYPLHHAENKMVDAAEKRMKELFFGGAA